MDDHQHFFNSIYWIVCSHLFPSFTTWCEWKSLCIVKVPPLITVFLGFVNIFMISDHRCRVRSEIESGIQVGWVEEEHWPKFSPTQLYIA